MQHRVECVPVQFIHVDLRCSSFSLGKKAVSGFVSCCVALSFFLSECLIKYSCTCRASECKEHSVHIHQ